MLEILNMSKAIENDIVNDRRIIHQNPEIGSNLQQTTKYVIHRLTEIGYSPKEICSCGVAAAIGKKGKTILLRADMDALPMQEETCLPFRSQNNYAHTCGHDTHTAMLLGAARLLKEHEAELEGTVILMFQPDEEGFTGASSMIKAGILENPKVDAAMAIHINSELYTAGCAAVHPGITMASADKFKITVTGLGGHGAAPHVTVDPINVACHINIALQELISREIDPIEQAVLTIGSFHSGSAANVIPQDAVMEGTIRTFSKELREFIKKRLVEISSLTAETFRAKCNVEFISEVSALYNNEKLTSSMTEYIKEVVGEDNLLVAPQEMGSEDFALIAERVPSTFALLGAGIADEKCRYSEHNPKVVFDEKALPIGSAIYAHCAIRWLKENRL